ncbi:MAG: hypothetical protein H6735_32450 [Alphaproteobacteria bacterium]|nr:hypothetical protein [Alphaproteobacteria bacterium]
MWAWWVLSGCNEQVLSYRPTPPQAVIITPTPGTSLPEGERLELVGQASDAETRPADLRARWLAGSEVVCDDAPPDADGQTRCTIDAVSADLSITLVVREPDGQSATASVEVAVREDEPPTALLAFPDDGATLESGVALVGFVSDDIDPIDTLRVGWSSDVDGELIAPEVGADGVVRATAPLSVGHHELVLWAEDHLGQRDTDAVEVDVVELCPDDDLDGICNADDPCPFDVCQYLLEAVRDDGLIFEPCADDDIAVWLDGAPIFADLDGWANCGTTPLVVTARPGQVLTLSAWNTAGGCQTVLPLRLTRPGDGTSVSVSGGYQNPSCAFPADRRRQDPFWEATFVIPEPW